MKRTHWLLAVCTVSSSLAVFAPAASATVSFSIDVAPPAPRYEVVPAVRPGYIWAPGYWDWRHGHHVWVRGHYIRERHGMYWHPDRWVQRDGRYVLEHGRWDRERYNDDHLAWQGNRDRDGDGVPNRYDRAPNNPYRQ